MINIVTRAYISMHYIMRNCEKWLSVSMAECFPEKSDEVRKNGSVMCHTEGQGSRLGIAIL